ncbi:single-stranded DNA-binding protein [Helicobacter sp. T3_23-1059]
MFNKVIIIGNLTRDVELKYLQSSSALATFGIASNRRYNKQDGSKAEEVCFVDVTLFGRTAEVANQYLRKGSKVLVEGRLVYDTWTDQNGQKRSKHSIVAESMKMLDTKNASGGYENNSYDDSYASQSNSNYGASNNAYQNSSNYGNSTGASNAGYGNYGAQNQTAQNSQNYQRQPSEQNIPSIDIDDDDIPF